MTNVEKLPETVRFKWYLHDEDEENMIPLEIFEAVGISNPSEEDLEELGVVIHKPFYEVTVECELNTRTGRINILKATN